MAFLVLAAVLIAVGVGVVMLRNRRPHGIDAGIDAFARKREALTPRRSETVRRWRGGGPG